MLSIEYIEKSDFQLLHFSLMSYFVYKMKYIPFGKLLIFVFCFPKSMILRSLFRNPFAVLGSSLLQVDSLSNFIGQQSTAVLVQYK